MANVRKQLKGQGQESVRSDLQCQETGVDSSTIKVGLIQKSGEGSGQDNP